MIISLLIARIHNRKLRLPGVLFLSLALLGAACTRQQKYPAPAVSGDEVVIEVSSLKTGTPSFYTYRYKDKNINFFVLRMDEEVQSYLDACASCYPHKLGYRCEDGSMICRNCGLKFSVHQLKKGLGGCYPIWIKGRFENGKYRIPLSVLEAEATKF
jgi:uncharacterized membrane protein